MFVTIINDCHDSNTFGRQETRASLLFNTHITPVGVDFNNTLQAAGNLIDILDASEGQKGVILVNVAPRHGSGKKWENGTPFGYFHYKDTLVVASISGYTLSFIKKLGLVPHINVMDIPTVINHIVDQNILDRSVGDHIIKTQFRSYDFVPRVAKWLDDGIAIPSEQMPVEEIDDVPQAVWWVDNFGNCKTTLFADEVEHEPGRVIKTKFGEFACYSRLKDVPNDVAGFIVGSSGVGEKRFLEIVIQGKSAAEKYNIKPGDTLFA